MGGAVGTVIASEATHPAHLRGPRIASSLAPRNDGPLQLSSCRTCPLHDTDDGSLDGQAFMDSGFPGMTGERNGDLSRIDEGTTRTRAMLFAADGSASHRARELKHPTPGRLGRADARRSGPPASTAQGPGGAAGGGAGVCGASDHQPARDDPFLEPAEGGRWRGDRLQDRAPRSLRPLKAGA